jgi:hypothetical protein
MRGAAEEMGEAGGETGEPRGENGWAARDQDEWTGWEQIDAWAPPHGS